MLKKNRFALATRAARIAVAVCALGGAALVAGCGQDAPAFQNVDITGNKQFGADFSLPDTSGKVRTLADYKGKVVVLFFGYTHCPDVCPTTLANLAQVLEKLDTQAYDVAVLFVSVDPDRDTQPVLARYVNGFAHQIDGLSGPPNGLIALTRRYRVLYSVTKDTPGHPYTVMHSNSVFFFDRAGNARLVTTSTDDVKGITEDVKRLLN